MPTNLVIAVDRRRGTAKVVGSAEEIDSAYDLRETLRRENTRKRRRLEHWMREVQSLGHGATISHEEWNKIERQIGPRPVADELEFYVAPFASV
jgi:hypothetical protein